MPKVHTCPYCSRNFRRPEHLRRHCRTHTGEKPYVCHCGARFTRNDLLRRHGRLEHPGQVDSSSHTNLSSAPGHLEFPIDTGHGNSTEPVLFNHVPVAGGSVGDQRPPTTESYVPGLEALDFASSHDDFESLTRCLGLHVDWFEPTLFEPAGKAVLLEDLSQGDARIQTTTAPNVAGEPNGPMPFTSRLIDHTTGNGFNQVQYVRQNPSSAPLIMTEDRLRILKSKIKQFKGSSDDVDLPSGYTFTKHLSAWEETLANHLPYIHVPTLRLNECIPELVLALAALGAQQRYETRASLLLYHTSKDIALERMRITRSRKGGASTVRSEQSGTVLQSACTLLTLLIFATWSADAKLVEEALELHSPLIFCLRDDGLGDDNEIPGQDWHSWAASETRIRIKLMAFCFLNLHTIAYDHPPALFWHEVNLRLPCTVEEWHAADPARWFQSLEQVTERQRCFPEALKQLLSMDGQAAQIQPAPSPFGNYVLLHGLIQRIHLIRQLTGPSALEEEDITKLQKSLSNWAKTWQRTAESSLNPRDDNGPITFTSVALLSLAHVRLHLNIGPYRHLAGRLPTEVAAALEKVTAPKLQQTDSIASALLYSIHALSIPVAIGIEYVVHSQGIFWCCQHALGSLECAVFLSKWLHAISVTEPVQAMNRSERYILHCLSQVLTEAVASADWGDTDTSLWLADTFHMGLAVLRIWSRVFSSNSAWPITVLIGKSLAIYADAYEHRKIGL